MAKLQSCLKCGCYSDIYDKSNLHICTGEVFEERFGFIPLGVDGLEYKKDHIKYRQCPFCDELLRWWAIKI